MPLSGNKVTAFTFRHQDQADKPAFASSPAFKQALDSQAAQLQTGLNGLIDSLMNALAGTSGAEQIGAAPITGVAGATIYAQLADIKAQLNGVVLGQIPDGTITAAKLANDVMTLIERSPQLINIERNQANLIAIAEINSQSLPQSGYGYDLFRGASLNLYSCAILDTFATNVAATIAAGATSVTLPTVAGLAAGREITLQDIVTESKRERLIIQSIVGNAVTFATPTVNAYAAQAKVYRSLGRVDTTAKKLLFGGASYLTPQTKASTVVASAYDTSGNNGRKDCVTANGWVIAISVNTGTSTIHVFADKNDGAGFVQLCTISGAQVGPAIDCFGNQVTILWNNTTTVYSNTFDVTTVTNTDQNANKVTVDTLTSVANNVSIHYGSDGIAQSTWSGVHSTYPNSRNVRSSKSTSAAVTAWAAPTQNTTNNTTGTDVTNPCIVVRSNNNPVIVAQSTPTTAYAILAWVYNGTSWTASAGITIYAGAANVQSNPCAAIAPNGRIWCAWNGTDATDTTVANIRCKYSDDVAATWVNAGVSAEKLTTGNTYNQANEVVSVDKNGNVYVMWQGRTAASTTYYQIRRIVWNGTAWGAISDLTSNTTNDATNPSTVDNNTLDFSDPLCIYKDWQASAVKFRGTWVATTTLPLTQEDNRYNITPPTGLMKELRSWIQYDVLTGFTVDSALSIVDSAANESFATMTPAVTDYTTYKENYFDGFVTTAKAKGTQRVTMKRASVNDNVGESKYLAAVIGG